MARWRRVEDDDFVGHGLYLFEDFGKGHGLVYTGDLMPCELSVFPRKLASFFCTAYDIR